MDPIQDEEDVFLVLLEVLVVSLYALTFKNEHRE